MTPFPGGAFGANDTLAVGVVGCGGRARHLLKALNKLPGVRVTALADVRAQALADTAPLAAAPLAAAGHSTTRDYHELLADRRVDAVLIATPDHQHVPCCLAALKAGKDVYVEKPLTHDAAEGRSSSRPRPSRNGSTSPITCRIDSTASGRAKSRRHRSARA